MPGITMIGDSRNASRHRPTSLPAEARSACRLLRLLKNPKEASVALLSALPPHLSLTSTLQDMGKHGWDHYADRQAENLMSLALHFAVTKKQKKKKTKKSSSKAVDTTNELLQDDDCHEDGPNTTSNTDMVKEVAATALVSDGSAVGPDKEEQVLLQASTASSTKQVWARILECLHLQVASRTTSVWGKKKIYEVYKLCAPAKAVLPGNLNEVQRNVEREFRSIFHGGGEDQSGCRVYALCRESGLLYIQINIGKPYDLQDEANRAKSGEKKKKKANEYVALIEPGSSLLCLTASRAPSGKTCRFTKYVLTALEAAVAVARTTRSDETQTQPLDESLVPTRFGDWTGTEPLELLREAQKTLTGEAVGRFAKMARDGTATDPLVELHQVSTECLVDRTVEKERLETARKHGRHVARLQRQQQQDGGGALVATNHNKDVFMDKSASLKQSRKRARDAELGAKGDCPVVERVAWKWTGRTSAAAAAVRWKDVSYKDTSSSLPTMEFKCGIVMEGTNVFEGLQQLVAAGLTKPTLPDYIRDAPTLGSATIAVDHGEFGGTQDFAAV